MATTNPTQVQDWFAKSPYSSGMLATPKQTPVANIDPNVGKATATNWVVKPNQTVKDQVKQIIAEDSPLMQQAATAAKQDMNKRGLLNSSMAIGAGQDAVIKNALPIAQQDATTYGSAAKYGADAANTMATFNAGNKLDVAKINQNTQLSQAADQFKADTNLQMQALDTATKEHLAGIEAKWRQGMQTSQSMAATYQSMIDNIQRVMSSPDMDGPAKQATINNLTSLYNNALKSQEAIAGLKLGDLLIAPDVNTGNVPVKKPTTPAKPKPAPVSYPDWQPTGGA